MVRHLLKAASFILMLAFFVSSFDVNAQCNMGPASPATLTPTCSNQTVSLGPGEYRIMSLTANVTYSFSTTAVWAVNTTSPLCYNGTGQANGTFTPGSSGNVNVGTNRNGTNPGFPANWGISAGSSVLTYRIVASAGGTTAGGTTPICQGSGTGNITLSGHTGLVIRWEKK